MDGLSQALAIPASLVPCYRAEPRLLSPSARLAVLRSTYSCPRGLVFVSTSGFYPKIIGTALPRKEQLRRRGVRPRGRAGPDYLEPRERQTNRRLDAPQSLLGIVRGKGTGCN